MPARACGGFEVRSGQNGQRANRVRRRVNRMFAAQGSLWSVDAVRPLAVGIAGLCDRQAQTLA